MAIQNSYVFMTAKQLYRERGRLKFSHHVQRNVVWKIDRRSLFIHSLISGYPYPPVYSLEDENRTLWFLDGKQRLSSVFDYFDPENGYALHGRTPDVDGFKIAGLKFHELPEEFRELIEGANFQIYQFRNVSEEQVREMFLRLNNNVPLSKFEKARVIATDDILFIIDEIKREKFFAKIVNLSSSQRLRFADEEVIMQIIMLLENDRRPLDISSKAIRRGLLTIKNIGVSEKVTTQLKDIVEYLNEAFDEQVVNLRKMHIATLFITASFALEKEVPASYFKQWTLDFLINVQNSPVYQYTMMRGTLRKIDVETRLNLMKKDFSAFLQRTKLFSNV